MDEYNSQVTNLLKLDETAGNNFWYDDISYTGSLISKSDLTVCAEDDSKLRVLFISSLSIPDSESLVSASFRYASMNALSIFRRGKEELQYIRHSLEFMEENLLQEIRSLSDYYDHVPETL